MKAWYFSNTERKLGFGDGRSIVLGETHTVDCDPVVCRRGLHGSKLMLDAFNYASGPVIWRVELGGKLDIGTDKIAATERTYLYGGVDVSDIFLKFGRLCALDVIHLCDEPDVVLQFLKTGDESLMAAASAAGHAAMYAAWAAASATGETAWASAWAAAREKQNRRLTAMVSRAIKEEL